MYNKSEGPYGNENIKEKMRTEKQENTNHNMLVGIIVAVVILGGIIWYFNSDSKEKEEFVYACVQSSKEYNAAAGGVMYDMCGSEAVTTFCECGYEKAKEHNLDDKEWDEITQYDLELVAIECIHTFSRCYGSY